MFSVAVPLPPIALVAVRSKLLAAPAPMRPASSTSLIDAPAPLAAMVICPPPVDSTMSVVTPPAADVSVIDPAAV